MAADKGLEEVSESKSVLQASTMTVDRTFPTSAPACVPPMVSKFLATAPRLLREANHGASPDLIETNYDEVTDSFDAMSLKQELLRGKRDV